MQFIPQFVNLKVHGALFNLFDSLRAGMWMHVTRERGCCKDMMFILNPNPTSLSF